MRERCTCQQDIQEGTNPSYQPPTHGMELYYNNLTAITIYYLKIFAMEYTLVRGWAKVPKNKLNAKVKIIPVLLAIMKEDEMGVFYLKQNCILSMLLNMRG